MRGYMGRLRGVLDEIARLQGKGDLSYNELMQLAQLQYSVGQSGSALRSLKNAVAKAGKDPSFDFLYTAGHLYRQCGQRGEAARIMRQALSKVSAGIGPNIKREMAAILADGGMHVEAETCLNDYLRTAGNDVDAWMQMAIIKDALGKVNDAHNAIRQAYQINANAAAERLRSSEDLQRIAAPLFRRR